jgi:hypothetical protein
MARYQTDRFEDAAKAYFKEFGLVPTAADAEEKAVDTKSNAAALAKKLPEGHAAIAGLNAVATLRDSIARRFIRLSVAPLAPAPKKTAQKAEAKPAAAPKAKGRKPAAPAQPEEPVAANA